MFNLDFIMFGNTPCKRITIQDLEDWIKDTGTKRVHFQTSHANALRKNKEGGGGKLILPFGDTIASVMLSEIDNDFHLFQSQFGGVWRGINSDEEYKKCECFIKRYEHFVFLRDNLDLSMALDLNFKSDGCTRTDIGELEYMVKYQNDVDAENRLLELTCDLFKELPYYKDVPYICAVPSSDGNVKLPQKFADKICCEFDKTNLSDSILWETKNKSLKNTESTLEKLELLKGFGLAINTDITDKNIVLLDDLYKSGLTIQYVAMKLKEHGAKRVFGLTIVKSLGND